MCWRKGKTGHEGDGAGHVAFVEKVYKNGDVLTSNSAYNGKRYYARIYKKCNGYYIGPKYIFQGFIYPPVKFTEQFNLTRLLKKGCRGNDVKELQKDLKDKGYSVGSYGADGIFGDDTLKAVKKFQKDNKLTKDGIVGKNTAHKLGWLYKGK